MENAEPGTPVGEPVLARYPDSENLSYSLTGIGRDKESFAIDEETGQLLTRVVLDYEQQRVYNVVVGVESDDGETDYIRVTIEVVDQEPEPTPTPSPIATPTPEPTATPTPAPTATPTPRPTATHTPEPAATPTPRPTATHTPEPGRDSHTCADCDSTPSPTATPTPAPAAVVTMTPAPIVEPPDEGGGLPAWLWLLLLLPVAALVAGGVVYARRRR